LTAHGLRPVGSILLQALLLAPLGGARIALRFAPGDAAARLAAADRLIRRPGGRP